MLFFPVVMNALQYYIIDSFIKDQKPSDHESIPSDDGQGDMEDSRDENVLLEDGEEETALIKKTPDARAKEKEEKEAKAKVDLKKLDEYDPSTDGASSSGSRDGRPDEPQRPLTTKDSESGTKNKGD